MVKTQNIAPWHCETCGREFGIVSVGTFSTTNRILCHLCLGIGIFRGLKSRKKFTRPICKLCSDINNKENDVNKQQRR